MAERIDYGRADRSLIDAVLTQLTHIDRTRAEVRRAYATRRVVLNLVVVLGIVAVAVTLLARMGDPAGGEASAVTMLMAGLAASAGGAAALMVVFAARLSGYPRVSWVGLAFGWYCLFAIPVSTLRGLDGRNEAIAAAGIVLVHGVAAVLWLVVLVAPAPPSALGVVRGLLIAVVVLVAAAALWGAAAPEGAQALAGSRPLWLAYALVWMVGALGVVARATVSRIPALGVIGVGLAMLGAAQAGGSVEATPSGAEMPPLFAALRVAAVVVVLWGSLWFARRALYLLDDEQANQEAELRRAEMRLARAAARDHDLRNGLAGLAGATAVLGGGAGTGHLSRVVAGELRRLDDMLQVHADDDSRDPQGPYAVAPALDGLVMLRRSAGMDVRADVEPGLHAVGSPCTLAQVVTNLLANAERHAPGSPVRITALGRGGKVEIRVRDFGPGIAAGREQAVLEPGVRDERAGGRGLGLHLCRTLLGAEEATIEVAAADGRAPGCVVLLVLPAGERGDPERPGSDRGDVRAAS
jgi:two-component system, OmpR family, sensor kinase